MLGWFEKWVETIARNVFWRDIRVVSVPKQWDQFPPIKVKLDDGAYLPVRAHETDAGADLFSMEDFTVPAHGSAETNTGVHVELPKNTVGMVKSKSGLNIKACVACEGVVDEGYTGAIRLRLYNHGDYDYHFKVGDKLTQLVVMPVIYPAYVESEEIDGGARGDAGFGSTGK